MRLRSESKELISREEAAAMIALQQRLAGPPDGIALDEVAAGMGLTPEAARRLLIQVRAESGTLSQRDLALLRQPPRLAVTALVTTVVTLAGIWGYFQYLYR